MPDATADDRDDAQAADTAAAGLEYRSAAAVSVDPLALTLMPLRECRRLRAIPLQASSGGAVVGVDSPSEELFETVRGLTQRTTRFVLLDRSTVDSLLSSRMFTEPRPSTPPPAPPAPAPAGPPAPPVAAPVPASTVAPAPPAPAPPVPAPPAAPPPAAAPAPAVAPPPVEEPTVTPLVRPEPPEPLPPAALAPSQDEPPGPVPAVAADASDLLAQIDAAVALWSGVRAGVAALQEELDAARRSLREAKEQLAVARAESDQEHGRIGNLEAELARSRDAIEAARRRLLESAEALTEEPQEHPEWAPGRD